MRYLERILFFALVLLAPSTMYGPLTAYLKIDGVEGESQAPEHEGEIDIYDLTWTMSYSAADTGGGGGGAGKVNIGDISLSKYMDKSTPLLMLKCASGEHIPQATLTCRKSGGTGAPVEYLVITMTDVLVSSVSTGGSGGEDRLTENVSLNFGRVSVKYVPQNPDGSPGSPVSMHWNIAENTGGPGEG